MAILETDLEYIESLGGELKCELLPQEQCESYAERLHELYSGKSESEMFVKEAQALAASSTLILN